MNTSYRTVWNEATGTWCVASELTKARGKKSSGRKGAKALAFMGTILALATGSAHAAQLCFDDNAGEAMLNGAGHIESTCQPNFYRPDGALDIAELEAEGTVIYVDGTNGVVGFRATSTGQIVTIDAAGKIQNVGAGAVSSLSKDAVNGAQLYGVSESIAGALGAGATVNADGTVEAPAYVLTNANSIAGTLGAAKDVGSAFSTVDAALGEVNNTVTTMAGTLDAAMTNNATAITNLDQRVTDNTTTIGNIDNRVTNVESSVTNITNQLDSGEIGLVQQDATTKAITVAKDLDGTVVNVAGTAGERTISGVKAGELTSTSTEAVNGSQLFATNTNVERNTSNIAKNAGDISTINTLISSMSGEMVNVVKYDPASHDKVTLDGANGTVIGNVKAGVADMDAVNVAQLKAAGLNTDDSGNVINTFVAYDSAAKDSITLGGEQGTAITNLKAGELSSTSTEAVNGSQLFATNANVGQNKADIAKNTGDIAVNTSDIANNAGAITNLDQRVTDNTTTIGSIDNRVTNVESSVTNIANQLDSGEIGLVQQDATTKVITVAKSLDGTQVDFAGTAGTRELVGVAKGTTNASAINLSQLAPTVNALGGGAVVNADGSVTGPTYHMQGGTQGTVGGALDVLDDNLTSLQSQINSDGSNLVQQDEISGDIKVAANTNGTRLTVSGTDGNRLVTGVAAGAVNALSSDAINGSQLFATAISTATALGGGSAVNADGTFTMPSYTVGGAIVNNLGDAISKLDNRTMQNSSDIANLQTTINNGGGFAANAVQYDSSAHDTITLGGAADAGKVKVTNLQDGDLSKTSTDAVTGSQLWETNQKVADLDQQVKNQTSTGDAYVSINTTDPAASASGDNAVAIGGGSKASGDHSVAIGNGATAGGQNSVAMGDGATAGGQNSVAIGNGSVADQDNTVSVGSEGNERRLTNVADGKAPTDAVNMRQFQSGMATVARNAYSGVAAATALTMIPDVDPGKTVAVGVGTANYKGYQATALGASARVTRNLKVKVGAGLSAGGTTVGAGASYQW